MNHSAQRGREARTIDAEMAGESHPLFKLPVFRQKHNLGLENNSSGGLWRRMQSAANPSLDRKFPLTGKSTGNFGPVSGPDRIYPLRKHWNKWLWG
jgi:hypothetical protein